MIAEGDAPADQREDVEMETALAIYGTTAAVVAVGAPLTAGLLDESGEFPTLAVLGISLLSGVGGFALAVAASDDERPCGGLDLYEEDVLLYDLMPLTLAAAPTLVAWPLSGASLHPGEQRAQLGVGAVADPERGVLVFTRLQL